MGQVFRDFTNDTVGAQPAGFTEYVEDNDWTVDEQARLRIAFIDGGSPAFLALDEAENAPLVVQVATRFRQDSYPISATGGGSAGVHDHRGTVDPLGSPAEDKEYFSWQVVFMEDETRLVRVTSEAGSSTTHFFTVASWPFVLPLGEWAWVRMEREFTGSDVFRAKAWQGLPGDEPVGWDVDIAQSIEGPFSYGFAWDFGGPEPFWDRLGVGWDGEPAPLEAIEDPPPTFIDAEFDGRAPGPVEADAAMPRDPVVKSRERVVKAPRIG